MINLDAAQFSEKISDQKVVILDVRTAAEFAEGHIPNAVNIDISNEQPKVLTTSAVEQSDVVITMGCGDACPFFPGKRYLDWVLPDPAGQGVAFVRPIRDQIKKLVEELIPTLISK